ncbi:MAG TPA: helix-turn-helix transcriptional regulator [Devosiaceae bacterium]|jgi:two-component system response regulator EvgA|nr:helix-turn-helix transcriptional regulator [Devosiaceae bacterium]
MDELENFNPSPVAAPAADEGVQGERAVLRAGLRNVPHVGFASLEDQQRAEEAFLSLSAREVTVLAYLAYGFSAKEVAITLNVSSRTVDTFRTRALLKLRARNTADAVRILAALSARARMAEKRG